MVTVGFHASHEQPPPSQLLTCACHAAAVGFSAVTCSDHLAPWSERQGHSGFAWSWLGAALQATQLPFGVVTAPGQRYHPVVLAQAIATLAEMFPGRFWPALGSGEAINEHVTGQRWPDKPTRDARLLECVEVIRALLRGEEVTHHGLVRVDRARVWSLPAEPPPLIGAAVSEQTARTVGVWADGLITINQELDTLRGVINGFREAGGDGKPIHVQVHLSWAPDEESALAIAHDQWRSNVFSSELAWNLEMPSQFDAAASVVRPEDLRGPVLVSSDLGVHRDRLTDLIELGIDGVFLHHVGREQVAFIDTPGIHKADSLFNRRMIQKIREAERDALYDEYDPLRQITLNTDGTVQIIYNPFTGNPNGTGREPFPNNRIPSNLLNPIALRIQELFPLPNVPGNNLSAVLVTYKPGEKFTRTKMRESQRNLYGLELFEFVQGRSKLARVEQFDRAIQAQTGALFQHLIVESGDVGLDRFHPGFRGGHAKVFPFSSSRVPRNRLGSFTIPFQARVTGSRTRLFSSWRRSLSAFRISPLRITGAPRA